MNSMLTFNWVDYAILAVIFVSVIISFFRGFIKEAISLVIWVAAVVVALKFAGPVGDLFKAHIGSETMRFVIAFVGLFLVVIIFGMVINALVRMLLDKTGLSIVDRILGLVFGFLRGVLLVSMVLVFVGMSPGANAKVMKQSWSVAQLQPVVSWLSSFVPEHVGKVSAWLNKDMKQHIGDQLQQNDQSQSA